MNAEEFLASLVDVLPEPTVMVSSNGVVLAANESFAAVFGRSRRDVVDTRLVDHVSDPADRVQEYLRHCAGTRQPLSGSLTVRGRDAALGPTRCQGWVVQPRAGNQPAVVGLRFLGKDAAVTRFGRLTRQIGELTAEISRRRRAEARLASALDAQTALQQRFEVLAGAPAALLASLTMRDVHHALGELARRLVPADAHAVWHFDGSDSTWRVVWQEQLSESFVREISTRDNAGARAVPFETPLAVTDVTESTLLSNRQEVYKREGITSLLVIPLRIRADNHGTIVAYFRRPVTFDRETLRVATALGNLGSSALTTATLYEFESRTRRRIELAEHGARFLARAAATLAASLNYEDTLRTIATLAVPEVADWCAVDILSEDGTLERLAVAHADPAKVHLAQLMRERYPEDPASPHGVHQVLRTNSPVMMPQIPETLVAAGARDAEHLDILRALGLRSYMCVPLAVHGRAIGVLTFVSAESGREYTQDDLRLAEDVASRAALAVENARAYEEARRANRLKDEFLATLSHELRTPLNAILGYIRMLRGGAVPPERQPHALEVVERNATALNDMVEDILDVSRIVAGKVRLNVQVVDVPGVVRDAIATVAPAAEAKGIRIQTVIDTGAPPVSGDPARLQQVVWNILANAVKFTPRGGRVQVRTARVNSHVEIVISDTGIGVPAEFLPHLFDAFRQADARFSREHGGLGLGLAIARHFVELHGGVITAASPGRDLGTTFRVRLPSMIVHHETHPEPTRVHPVVDSAASTLPAATIAGIHVLAVDDEPDSRALLAEVLQAAGARVTLAGSGIEALQALEHERPDVIITDIGMPEMDGFELIARVRQSGDATTKSLPVAALTAYARSEDRVRSLQSGFQMHLAKPINPRELVAAVRVLAKCE